jgi:hypothetical protein
MTLEEATGERRMSRRTRCFVPSTTLIAARELAPHASSAPLAEGRLVS